ncbi:MAG: hypothetical protein ACXQT4_05955 [Methanotrichaceae archaeon]
MESDDKTIVYGIIAACVIGIIIVGALVLSSDTSEGFSELYFEDHTELPKMVEVDEEVNFAFTVVSHEKVPINYTYNITFDNEVIDKGNIVLEPRENETINMTLVPRNSSLVFFDVPHIAVSYIKLDEKNSQVQLPWGAAEITIPFDTAKPFSWNLSEVRRIGNPDSLNARDLDFISSLGYISRKEQYQVVDDQLCSVLKYVLNETEYRYEFKKVSVNVSSQQTIFKDQDTNIADEGGHEYEIHFWIIVKEDPENLVDL